MKEKDIEQLKNRFGEEYGPKIRALGNNLAYGIGKDMQTGEYTIRGLLTNEKGKNLLPANYYGVLPDIFTP